MTTSTGSDDLRPEEISSWVLGFLFTRGRGLMQSLGLLWSWTCKLMLTFCFLCYLSSRFGIGEARNAAQRNSRHFRCHFQFVLLLPFDTSNHSIGTPGVPLQHMQPPRGSSVRGQQRIGKHHHRHRRSLPSICSSAYCFLCFHRDA